MTYDLSFYHFMLDYRMIIVALGITALGFILGFFMLLGPLAYAKLAGFLALATVIIAGIFESQRAEDLFSSVVRYADVAQELDAPVSDELLRVKKTFIQVSEEGYFKTAGFVNPFNVRNNPDVDYLQNTSFLTKSQYLALRDHIQLCQIDGEAAKTLEEIGGYPVSKRRASDVLASSESKERSVTGAECNRESKIILALISHNNSKG